MHVPAFFIYYEQNLSNKISGCIIIQVLRPPTFQFQAASSRSPYDMIIYEPGASTAGGNNYLTYASVNNPLKNITATTERSLATWFVIYPVL